MEKMKRKPPTSLTPDKQLPKGVESVNIDSDGHETYVLNPIQAEVQWSEIAVDSSSFEKLTVSEKLYEQAVAFLSASKVLCKKAGVDGQAGKNINWPQGSVCYYCMNIATELFLKACISRSSSGEAPQTHNLKKLLQLYEKVLPGSEFQFQIPILWKIAISEIENALGGKLFTQIDKNPDQFYRYGIGKDGAGSGLTHRFVPDIVFNRIIHLEKIWLRAWQKVCETHG